MRVLVAYSSKYGSTRGIADRIGERLRLAGHEVDVERCDDVEYPEGFDAFVVGAATYMFNWRKEARRFVRHNHELLASRPTWLFASGPLGTSRIDKEGNDVLAGAQPRQFADYEEELHPRGTMVFFGALDIDGLRGSDRILSWMPENDALPEGDFRDWDAIDAWADAVAAELATQPA
ncbi:flavodoxin domain-containing protein [Agromyces aurantiacus]|uniref:Flavodoxin domain-containing protein n=1 Tax=Agromyces aurantiacus TaxID=165814 RepID=A0ABV9R829_9MICO|nr:flavodoxin domain-containing protein [Agromyces aurantiacus]MBM7505164.1 menaquinone-dependent protoporphyrinogen oxidase [Agromyces aurantiacus]